VATDIETGLETIIKTGDLIAVFRVSVAVPGIPTPVRFNGRVLDDGGLFNPVRTSAVCAMSADFVIVVVLMSDIATDGLSRHESTRQARAQANAVEHLLQRLCASNSPALAQFTEWLRRQPLPGIVQVLLGALLIIQTQIRRTDFQQEKPGLTIQSSPGHNAIYGLRPRGRNHRRWRSQCGQGIDCLLGEALFISAEN